MFYVSKVFFLIKKTTSHTSEHNETNTTFTPSKELSLLWRTQQMSWLVTFERIPKIPKMKSGKASPAVIKKRWMMSSFNAQLNRAFQHFDVRSGTLREFTQCFLMARFIRNCIPGSQKLCPFFHQDFHVNLLRCRHRGVKRCLDNCLDKLVQNSSHKTRTRWLRKIPHRELWVRCASH